MSFLRDMEKMNSMDLYNMNDKAKTSRAPSDSYLLLDSADRSTSTSTGGSALPIPVSQPYNNFRLQKPENLIQGGFTRLSLTEIRFPYALLNVVPVNNQFWVVLRTTTGDIKARISVNIASSFTSYNGQDLASRVLASLNSSAVGGAVGWGVLYAPSVPSPFSGYDYGGFDIYLLTNPLVVSFALYPVEPILNYPNQPTVATNPNVKSLLDVMGYHPVSNWDYLTDLRPFPPLVSISKVSNLAPMTFTKYIDIVSSKLTYYQNVKDGTTKAGSKDNIICRLYITDETSTTPTIGQYWNGTEAVSYQVNPPAGNIPFVIHRQFKSPKQFLWDKNTAVDWIDIQLFDDYGQPLYVPPEGLPDFQITFKATED